MIDRRSIDTRNEQVERDTGGYVGSTDVFVCSRSLGRNQRQGRVSACMIEHVLMASAENLEYLLIPIQDTVNH